MTLHSILVDANGNMPHVNSQLVLVAPLAYPSVVVSKDVVIQEVPPAVIASYGDPQRPQDPLALRALGILRVAQNQRFHPRTGQPTKLLSDATPGVTVAPDVSATPGVTATAQGDLVFPRIDPAIICRVVTADNSQILLGQNKLRTGYYSLIAGYVSLGETLEEATLREIKEETQLEVRDISYVCSQPWPFSGSLMVGMQATASGTPYPADGELLEVRWFARHQVAQLPLPQPNSIAYRMIQQWMEQA